MRITYFAFMFLFKNKNLLGRGAFFFLTAVQNNCSSVTCVAGADSISEQLWLSIRV
jgi:hypothetical protein